MVSRVPAELLNLGLVNTGSDDINNAPPACHSRSSILGIDSASMCLVCSSVESVLHLHPSPSPFPRPTLCLSLEPSSSVLQLHPCSREAAVAVPPHRDCLDESPPLPPSLPRPHHDLHLSLQHSPTRPSVVHRLFQTDLLIKRFAIYLVSISQIRFRQSTLHRHLRDRSTYQWSSCRCLNTWRASADTKDAEAASRSIRGRPR